MLLHRAGTAAGIAASTLVAVALIGFALLLLRRRLLFRRGVTVACALRAEADRPWQGAVARFDPDAIRAYRFVGLTLRPYEVLARDRMVLGTRRPANAGERTRLMTDPVVLAVRAGDRNLEMALGTDALPGLLAWVEGRPVR